MQSHVACLLTLDAIACRMSPHSRCNRRWIACLLTLDAICHKHHTHLLSLDKHPTHTLALALSPFALSLSLGRAHGVQLVAPRLAQVSLPKGLSSLVSSLLSHFRNRKQRTKAKQRRKRVASKQASKALPPPTPVSPLAPPSHTSHILQALALL